MTNTGGHEDGHIAEIPPPTSQSAGTHDAWFTRTDWIIAVLLFLLGATLGTRHILYTAGKSSFYEEYFAPVVAAGCGKGFVHLSPERVPSLGPFLARQRDSVSCEEVLASPAYPINAWHTMHRYQMGAAALIWRLRGEVSWTGLAPLFGILFGATIPIGYAIARLLLGRGLALAVALLLLISPINLGILPLLRDYSKAPFFLGIILMIGICIRRPMTLLRTLVMAAVAGLIAGVGFGFRTDVLVCAPPMMVALSLFAAGRWRNTWRQRIVAPLVFLAVFIVVALPPLQGMGEGGANAHVTLLGFSTPFDAALGLDRPYYEWAYSYNDTLINALLSSYSQWKVGNTTPFQTNTKPYEKAGNEYLVQLAQHFPADVLTRAYAAVLRILELPANGLSNKLYLDPNQHAIGIASPKALGRYLVLQRLVQLVTSGGAAFPLFAVTALLIIAARNVRIALCVAFIILYFSAYTFLQFSLRHTFHLEIFGWLAAAFVLQSLIVAIRAWRRRDEALVATLQWKPVLTFALVIAIVPASVLYAARTWQDAHVRQLMPKYLAAEKKPVAYDIGPGSSPDRVLLRLQQDPPPAGMMRLDYLVIEVRNDRTVSPMLFRNSPILAPSWKQVRTVLAQRPPSLTDAFASDISRYFFPAYSGPESLFEGVEIPRETLDSLAGIYRIERTPELPMLLYLTLHSDWRERPQHQRLYTADLRRTVRVHHDAKPPGEMTEDLFAPSGALGNIVKRGRRGRLRVHGHVDTTNGTLVQYPSREMKKGATLIVEGTNHYGCSMTILNGAGLFQAGIVEQPGPFRVELTAPADGVYTPLIADLTCIGPTDFTINRAGWAVPR